MSKASTAQASIAAAVTAARAVAQASRDEEYTTRQQAEAAISEVRTLIQTACTDAIAAWGNDAYTVVRMLKALAASLLDLDRALAEELQTREVVLTTERSLLDLARQLYASGPDTDIVAWAARLAVLNPGLRDINRIRAGTTVLAYVQ